MLIKWANLVFDESPLKRVDRSYNRPRSCLITDERAITYLVLACSRDSPCSLGSHNPNTMVYSEFEIQVLNQERKREVKCLHPVVVY